MVNMLQILLFQILQYNECSAYDNNREFYIILANSETCIAHKKYQFQHFHDQ